MWIDSEDQKPGILDAVLCIDEFGYMQVAGFADYWYSKLTGEKLINGQITHWRQLPEPPKIIDKNVENYCPVCEGECKNHGRSNYIYEDEE